MRAWTAEDLDALPCVCCGKVGGCLTGENPTMAVFSRCCRSPELKAAYRAGAMELRCPCGRLVVCVAVARRSMGSLASVGDA